MQGAFGRRGDGKKAGHSCPAQRALGEADGRPGDITKEEEIAILAMLRKRARCAPRQAEGKLVSALAWAAFRLAAAVLLVAGVGVGLGDGNEFDDVGCTVAQRPSGKAGDAHSARAGHRGGGKVPDQVGAAGGAPNGGGPGERRFVLQKGLGGWRLVFDGRESVLPDEKGVAYVVALLRDPPAEPIHGTELAHRAFGDAIVEGQRNLGMEDRESVKAVRAARRKCQAVIDDPDTSGPEREEAQRELEEIEAWALKHLRGTEGNEQRQVRAIRQAIRRFLDELRDARNERGEPDAVLRGFGEHLERYLWEPSGRAGRGRFARVRAGLAGRFTYEPPEGVGWKG